MENELLIPLFWTVVFASLIIVGLRRFTKKVPTEKRWVRPESNIKTKSTIDENEK
ncbi:hypothetical protein [Prochlorococcus sp. MIT 1223]|uniref:hypothetical protein n=1 Tax=Prochlorococcus sp. MIT 1223 TaxID=3096217 RepID=UPI002A7644AF|nr:hypothetical protein [Prochlorococcus sp. MIT 1223]